MEDIKRVTRGERRQEKGQERETDRTAGRREPGRAGAQGIGASLENGWACWVMEQEGRQ